MPEVVVSIGPHHPALKEPVNFKVIADGEKNCPPRTGTCRITTAGSRKAGRTARLHPGPFPCWNGSAGICSHSPLNSICQGNRGDHAARDPAAGPGISGPSSPNLSGCTAISCGSVFAAHLIGFNTLFMWTWRGDREAVQGHPRGDERETASHYGMKRGSGVVRRDLTPGAGGCSACTAAPISKNGSVSTWTWLNYEETMLPPLPRWSGKLSKEEGLSGTVSVGPTARASGIDYDVRKDDPYLAYAEAPWNVVTDTHGDVLWQDRGSGSGNSRRA